MPLFDTTIRNAKPREKAYRLFDGGGLYLEVSPAGGKLWRLKYRFGGKEKRLALGSYPVIGLVDARQKRDAAKKLIFDNIDPAVEKIKQKALAAVRTENTFEAVASEWLKKHFADKVPAHKAKVVSRLERFVFPYLGPLPIADITAPLVLSTLRRIENKGETAKRVLQNISQVMRYAVATGCCIGDPTPALRGALPPVKVKHMAAPTEPVKVGEFLRMLEAVTGGQVVESAVRLLPYLFVRPGEFRQMQWKDVDFESKEWRFVATKTNFDHIVPLSRQSIEILSELKPLTSRNSIYVFPNARTPFRPMTDAAQCAAYRRLGIDTQNELTAHGWRAVARTLLHEKLGFAPEVIEHQLAHKVPDSLGRAYNRTKFLDERKRMMQVWADYLDELRASKTV